MLFLSIFPTGKKVFSQQYSLVRLKKITIIKVSKLVCRGSSSIETYEIHLFPKTPNECVIESNSEKLIKFNYCEL